VIPGNSGGRTLRRSSKLSFGIGAGADPRALACSVEVGLRCARPTLQSELTIPRHIPGTGMISVISIQPPGIIMCG
jgi:hypothetical protein